MPCSNPEESIGKDSMLFRVGICSFANTNQTLRFTNAVIDAD